MIFDQSGELANVSRHDYLPFGEELLAGRGDPAQGYQGGDRVRQQFTSKERDVETGLDYVLARYYSSTQGRFTSPDEFSGGPDELYHFADDASNNPTFYAELDFPQSLNKYQYTYNDPTNMIDPDGHCPTCPPSIAGFGDGLELITNPSRALDKLQIKLSVIGMVPGAGEVADGANAVISTARGNYGDAVLDVAGMAGPIFSTTAAINRLRKLAKVVDKADDVADAAKHGNSIASTKPQHLYEIADQTGDVKKVGVSGQQLNQNGTSPRANRQVNNANKTRTGKNQLSARVVKKNVKSRQAILRQERRQATKRKKEGNSMELHKRP